MSRLFSTRWLIVPPWCLVMIGGWIAIAEPQARSAITNQGDAIWVYYTSLCPRPHDASECVVQHDGDRPVFTDHQTCASHRDRDLANASNPRLLGSCRKQHAA